MAWFRTPAVHLAFAACTIATLFAALLVAPLPLWSAQPAPLPAPGGPPPEPAGSIGLLIPGAFVLALCLPFRPYVQAPRVLAHKTVSPRALLATTAVAAHAAVLIYPGYGRRGFAYLGFRPPWVGHGD